MMRLPDFRYRAPRTIEDAAAWLAEDPANTMLLAGGTDLLPNMKRRQQTPATLIGLRAIGEFAEIHNGDGVTVGAGVTLSSLIADPRIRQSYPGLWQAAAQVATPHLRNMGTIGGNLCLDTRCTYYDQNYEWRKSIDFCMKKDGQNVLGRHVEPEVPGGVVDRHRADAAGAGRIGHARSRRRPARVARLGLLRERRHALPDQTPGRDPDLDRVAGIRRVAQLVLEAPSPWRVRLSGGGGRCCGQARRHARRRRAHRARRRGVTTARSGSSGGAPHGRRR